MRKIAKNIIALSISSALSVSFLNTVNAATYQIVDESESSQAKYTYAQQQNTNGDMVISGTSLYNFPVQFDYLDDSDFTAIQLFAAINHESVHALNDLEDIDALKAGNPTANDLSWVIRWLQDTSSGTGNDIEYQKVGDSIAITTVGGLQQEYSLFDTTFDGTEQLTRSTVDIIAGITDSGISYGSATAPYLPSEIFTDEDDVEHIYWLREHGMRGFYSYNQGSQVHEIVPLEADYGGGFSALMDVNEVGVAVGFSSYKLVPGYADFIESEDGGCADTEVVPATKSLEACIAEVQTSSTSATYDAMAIKATLNPDGLPIIEELGLLVTPHEDDERSYSSYALALNSNGVAVGYADGFYDQDIVTPTVDQRKFYQYAVAYKNGSVIDISGDHSIRGTSVAYDINDAGTAVGYVTNSSGVRKFFYVDTNAPTEEINLVTPDDFFSGSDSTARAINNNDLVVGEGEIETHNESTSNPRRTAGFVYDLNNDVFTNLNLAIPCALRSTYNIIEAQDINDDGIISATATIKVERRDAYGEVMVDDFGTPLTEDVLRAITLEPTPDTGEVCTSEEEEKVVRQGASINVVGLLSIMALFGLRRKFFS